MAVILLGVFGVVLVAESQESPGEEAAENVSEFTENVGDEIDDSTDAS